MKKTLLFCATALLVLCACRHSERLSTSDLKDIPEATPMDRIQQEAMKDTAAAEAQPKPEQQAAAAPGAMVLPEGVKEPSIIDFAKLICQSSNQAADSAILDKIANKPNRRFDVDVLKGQNYLRAIEKAPKDNQVQMRQWQMADGKMLVGYSLRNANDPKAVKQMQEFYVFDPATRQLTEAKDVAQDVKKALSESGAFDPKQADHKVTLPQQGNDIIAGKPGKTVTISFNGKTFEPAKAK